VLAPAAAALAAAAITLGIVWNDWRTGRDYNDTLHKANGKQFEAYSLEGAAGAQAGSVFSYEGAPNWLLITVDPQNRGDLRSAQLVMDDGRRVPLNWFHLDPSGSSGGGILVDPHQVSVLRLLPGAGGAPLVAKFGG
jgi:hypothetical protein